MSKQILYAIGYFTLKRILLTVLILILIASPVLAWDENGTHITLAGKDPEIYKLIYQNPGGTGASCNECHKKGGMAHILPEDNPTPPRPTVTEVVYGMAKNETIKPIEQKHKQNETIKQIPQEQKQIKAFENKSCEDCHPKINICADCHKALRN